MEKESLRSSSLERPQQFQPQKGKVAYQEPAAGHVHSKTFEKISMFLMNADILLKFEEKELARHLLRQALYLNSHHPEALRRLAISLDEPQLIEQKIFVLKALVKNDYGFQTLADLAHGYYKVGRDAEALEIYRKALSTFTFEEEGLFEVYKNIGNILVKERDFDGAEEYYNKAFTLRPSSDALQVNLGTLDLQTEQNEKSLGRFRKALELNPKNDRAWVGLALVHNAMGDHVLARANLENAIDVNPFNRTAVQLAAAWAIRDQQFDSAIEYLQNYLAQSDFDEDISLVLTHLFCLQGRHDLANLEIERFLLWNPTHEQALEIEKEIRGQLGS